MSENEDIGYWEVREKAEFYNPSNGLKRLKNSFAVGKQSEESGDITWSRDMSAHHGCQKKHGSNY
ncbi:MAG: hypothetical protein R2942_15890 [Ignavibacteria bacterium]